MKHTKKYILGAVLYFIMVVSTYAGLPFNITVAPGTSLPTSIAQGGTATAYYTIQNNSLSVRSQNFLKWLPPNVTQVTTDTQYCGANFTLQPHGQSGDSCVLKLTVTGATAPNSSQPIEHQKILVCYIGGKVCAGPPPQYQLNVTVSPAPPKKNYLYVSILNGSNYSVMVCPLANDGTIGTCTSEVSPTFNAPVSIQVNPANTMAFIANSGDSSLSVCPIDQTTGLFGACTSQTFGGFSFITNPFFMTFSAAGALYIPNQGAPYGVSGCAVDSNGISNCNLTTASFNLPYQVAINNTSTFAYTANAASSDISVCSILPDFSLGSCTNTTGGATMALPVGIVMNKTSTYIYVASNNTSEIDSCSINLNGSIGACIPYSAPGEPTAIVLNSENTMIYYTASGANDIGYCPVNSDGSLGGCATVSSGGTTPFQLVLNPSENMLYANLFTAGKIASCPINADGTLSACTANSQDFTLPIAIALAQVG